MRRIPLVSAAALILLAATAVPASAGPANGQPASAGTGSTLISAYLATLPDGYQDNQLALMEFNTRLMALPEVEQAGYVGSVDDAATRSVTVYWYDRAPLPASVSDVISSAGVRVTVKPWPYNRAQIEAASRRLLGSAHSVHGFDVQKVVGFDPAYSGLKLEGDFTSATATAASVAQAAASIAGLPVKVAPGTSGGPAGGSRDSDYAPFYAGGLMYSPSGSFCSSGFAVNYAGGTHITTARHCRNNDYEAPDRTTSKYGSTTVWANNGQGRLMTATGAGYALDGAWNSVNFWKGVVGYRDLSVGDYVCTDGANSGVHCGVKVTNLLVYWNDGWGTEPNIEATVGSGIAVIQGDSGGPVIVPLSNGTQVYAAGMIQFWAGTNLNPNCGATWYTGGNACSRTVGFTSMRTLVNGLSGASLVLGS